MIGENKGGVAIPNDSLSDFCAISELVLSKDEGKVHISNNRYNPSYEDFENGDCSYPFISSKEIFELKVQVNPNPASEFVFISSPENLNTIRLIHISGNIVFEDKEVNNKEYVIPVASYLPGMYMLELTSGKKKSFRKIIIERN